jgi:oligo-1,6-glucosidase
VWAGYRQLIALRHAEPAIAVGELAQFELLGADVVHIVRAAGESRIEAVINLSGLSHAVSEIAHGEVLFTNLAAPTDWLTLAPWQAVVIRQA